MLKARTSGSSTVGQKTGSISFRRTEDRIEDRSGGGRDDPT